MHHRKEEWKYIRGYNNAYQISDKGRVKSLKRKVVAQKNHKTYFTSIPEKIMSLNVNSKGYHVVKLSVNGKYKSVYVHRLVANAYVPNPNGKPEVNHKDGVKTNNTPSNLEWTTRKENAHHAIEALGVSIYGSNNPRSKLTKNKVLSILKNHHEGVAISKLSNTHNVTYQSIWAIVKGKTWINEFNQFKLSINLQQHITQGRCEA